ncbi:MAG: hypothetical protein KF823_00140 [Xanthomonadales bacterium]|nr:hypothetical protein [Xanthomonadales bacterium]
MFRPVIIATLALAPLLSAHADPRFEVVDLSALLPANGGSQLVDLRDNGTASGMLLGSGSRWKPVVWRGHVEGDVEVFDGGFYDEHFLRAGNGNGLIVGQLPGSSIGWARVGNALQCIPTPNGCGAAALYLASIGNDVNESGEIVGQRALALPGGGFRFEAYRARVDGQGNFLFQGLGLYEETFNTSAQAIDNLGRIAGFATLNAVGAQQQALLWTDAGIRVLGPPGRNRRPTAISDSGRVVGVERGPGNGPGGFFALRWHVDDPAQPGEVLPALSGAISTLANDVNDAGSVVGTAQLDDSPLGSRGWLLEGGTLQDLNDLLPAGSPWLILAANAINTPGDIAATARFGSTPGTRAVLLRRLPHDAIFASSFAGP